MSINLHEYAIEMTKEDKERHADTADQLYEYLIAEYGDDNHGIDAITAFIDQFGEPRNKGEFEDSAEVFRESYPTPTNSLSDWGEELFYEFHQVPESIQSYIDTDLFTRDLFIGGDYTAVWDEADFTYWVFQNN